VKEDFWRQQNEFLTDIDKGLLSSRKLKLMSAGSKDKRIWGKG